MIWPTQSAGEEKTVPLVWLFQMHGIVYPDEGEGLDLDHQTYIIINGRGNDWVKGEVIK